MGGRRSVLPSHMRQVRPLRLTIASADDSIEPPRWDDGEPAVRAQRNLDGSVWAYSYADGTERWMHVPGIASFRFGSCGEEATVVPEPGTPPVSREIIEDTYQRAVLPMALHAHGDEVIHASAVLTEDGVVAFCGQSRSGKSTVAYGLHRRGCRVWADDTLVFDASAEIIQAIPYPHRLRIRAEAAEYFDLRELRRRDTSSWTKLEQAQAEPAPLACVFLLERDEQASTPVETVRLTPAQALARVIEHAYLFRLDDAERTRQMIGKYLVLATQVPAFRMQFRAALDQLPDMLDQAESIVRVVASER
jgi:hypothetical protein